MKIFVSEYIILYETFDCNLFDEIRLNSFFFDYTNFFESLYKLNNRFVYKRTYYIYDAALNNKFLRRQQIAHEFFWRRQLRRRNIFFKLIPHYFLTPRKWLKLWATTRMKAPMLYKFAQYDFINSLVMNFYVDHSVFYKYRIEIPRLDCFLLNDIVYNHFPRDFYMSINKYFWWRKLGFVFYKPRVYKYELLSFAIRWYKDGIFLTVLNPDSTYFLTGNNMIYAKKWVHFTYMVYNPFRLSPFKYYGYWTSDFFTEIFSFKLLNYRKEVFFFEPLIKTETFSISIYSSFFLFIFLFFLFILVIDFFFD